MIDGEVVNETSLVKPTFTMDVEVKIPDNLPKVEHNLDKLKEYAINLNEFYKKVVITSNDIKEAESEKAKLNRLIEQVKRLRIDKVKEYKQPAEDFEKTAKEIETILGDASDTIKTSLDIFENKRIEEKQKNIIKPILNNAISQAFVKGYLIDINRIIENPKWYNKTYKDADIENDIQFQIDEIIREEDALNQGIEVIKSNIKMANNSNLNEAVYIERFKYSRDLTSVLNDISRDNNVSHETLKEQQKTIDDIFGTTVVNDNLKPIGTEAMMKISFMGNGEQIGKIRAYAKEIGMEEV